MYLKRFLTGLFVIALVGSVSSRLLHAEESQADKEACEELKRTQALNLDKLTAKQLGTLGFAHDVGTCVEQDYAKAYDYYNRTVALGDGSVGLRLGYLYLKGLGVEPNEEKARYWFRSKALAGFYSDDRYTPFMLGLLLLGDPPPLMLKEEIERAKAEASGPPEAMMKNYRDLLVGNGVNKAPKSAISWLIMASTAMHPEALYELAYRSKYGDGVEKNEWRYTFKLRMAANKNHALAQRDLGIAYMHGFGVDKFPHMGMVWLIRARKNGLDVEKHIQDAEPLFDGVGRKSASEAALDFDFSQRRITHQDLHCCSNFSRAVR